MQSDLAPVEPPGYHLLNGWLKYITHDTSAILYTVRGRTWMRLLSALFGALTVLLAYRIGRYYLPPEVAFAPALLLALSLYGIYYSQENRPYAAVSAFSLLAFYLYIRIYLGGSRRLIPLYALTLALLGYLHYLAIMVMGIQLVALVATLLLRRLSLDGKSAPSGLGRRTVYTAIAVNVLATALFLPWLPKTLQMSVTPEVYHPSVTGVYTGWSNLPWRSIASTLAHWGNGGFAALAIYGVLAVIGLAFLFHRSRAILYLCLSYYLVPFLFLAFSPYGAYVHPRYLIFAFPVHQLLAGTGIAWLAILLARRWRQAPLPHAASAVVLVACLILFIPQIFALSEYYANGIKCREDVRRHERFCREHVERLWNVQNQPYYRFAADTVETSPRPTMTEAFTNRAAGAKAFDRGDFRSAVRHFYVAYLAEPNDYEVRYELARSMTAADFRLAAERRWEAFFRECRDFGRSLEGLNTVGDMVVRKRLPESLFRDAYDRLARENGGEPTQMLSLLQARQRLAQELGRWNEALETVDTARRISPPEQRPGLNLSEASIRRQTGMIEEAMALLRQNLHMLSVNDPLFAESAAMLSICHAERREFLEASQTLAQAISSPFEPTIVANAAATIAREMESSGEPGQAEKLLSSVAGRLSGQSAGLLHIEIGKLALARQDRNAAREAFAAAAREVTDEQSLAWLAETMRQLR